MRRWTSLLTLLLALLAAPSLAVTPGERLADPALEARARELSLLLRCQVCQNQTIDDSNAPLATDLRKLVRERLVAGDSDQAVLDFMVQRYGDYVLMRPPVKPATWGLWFGPALVFLAAAGGLAVYLRRRRPVAVAAPAPLSPEEQRRLERIVAGDRAP